MRRCWGNVGTAVEQHAHLLAWFAMDPHDAAVVLTTLTGLPISYAPASYRYRPLLLLRYAPSLCCYCPLNLMDAPALRDYWRC